jgi:hypothetical protein
MSGAYFVCELNLKFLNTHLPAYLAICGQRPEAWRGSPRCNRRHELHRLVDDRLARREVSEAHSPRTSLYPSLVHIRGLFHAAAPSG